MPDAPDAHADGDRDWRHPWLRINLVLREMKHLVFRVRDADARPVLKAAAEQGDLDAGEDEAPRLVELTGVR